MPRLPAVLFVLLAYAAPALAQTPAAPAPTLVIIGAGAGVVTHAAGDPLLVSLNVLNTAAEDVAARNLENEHFVADAAASSKFQQLPELERRQILSRYQQSAVPAVVVGTAGQPIAALIRFVVTTGSGAPVDVPVRPLASSGDVEGPLRLDDRRSALLDFGIDAAALAALAPGRYAIRAALDSPGGGSRWQGRVESPPLEIELRAGAGAAGQRRLDQSSRFYLLDAQYGDAERTARAMIALDEAGPSGWSRLGDALDGQGRLDEALDAFGRARDLYYAARPDPGPADELPVYVEQRILDVQARIKAR